MTADRPDEIVISPGMMLNPASLPPLPDPDRDACCSFCGTIWLSYRRPRVVMDCCDARRMIEHHRVQRDEARADADRLRAALQQIAANGCGLPGHAVATGCGSNAIAAAALEGTDQ